MAFPHPYWWGPAPRPGSVRLLVTVTVLLRVVLAEPVIRHGSLGPLVGSGPRLRDLGLGVMRVTPVELAWTFLVAHRMTGPRT
jgi:hypothetical protein